MRSRLQAARRARADPLRRARGRAGAAPPGARARARRATVRSSPSSASPASGSRGSSGSSPTRTAPTAGSSSQAGSVSYGKATPLSAGHRSAQGLLPDRGPRRARGDPREGDGQAPDAGPGAGAASCPRSWRCSTSRSRTPRGRPSTRRNAASGPSTRVKRLLLRESQVQPLLVVFEDLHWIDAETQALLDSLVESLPTARLLLLVNYRPEYRHAWGGKTYYRQLRLDPLPPESAEELLDALLGDDAAPRAAQAAPDRADRGQPVLPGGERPDAGRDGGAGRRAGRLSAGDGRRTHRRSRPRCRRSWPRASTGSRPRTSASSRPPRSSARTCRSRCSRRSPTMPEDGASPGPRPPPGGRVPLRDAASSRTSSTPSSTR